MKATENYHRWLNSVKVDKETKNVLRSMSQEEIDDAFYRDIEFGTAGMRGILGPGTNRLNEFTIRKACVAFAMYLIEKYDDAFSQGVVIAHDNRHMSREFTLLCSEILNDFGLQTYVFDSLRPTPELSYAVHHLSACGGIMITASHNPKEYNGFKVYDEKGCQLVPDKIARLLEIIDSLPNELDLEYEVSPQRGKRETIKKEVDDSYLKAIESLPLHPELDKSHFKIVFSPNHGTTYKPLMKIFKDLGYDVYPVKDQCDPDPDFSHVPYPNPEDPLSFEEAKKLAQKVNADLIIITDPDGDRVGLAFHARSGVYRLLNGNEAGLLLFEYLCQEKIKNASMPSNPIMYTTIVSSPLGEKIANHYHVMTKSFLTGFKYIGDQIGIDEEKGYPTFIYGFEESCGCLVAPFVRDKDALQASIMYAEMALYYLNIHHLNLGMAYDKLSSIYGYHHDMVKSVEFKGSVGAKEMEAMMNHLRRHPFSSLLDLKVICREDYLTSKRERDGRSEEILLPKSNALRYTFNDGSVLALRPSGTEPKVKMYVSIVEKNRPLAMEKTERFFAELYQYLGL